MTKPTSTSELESWVAAHELDGTINGKVAIAEGTKEFRFGYVPGTLYDLALLRSAPLSWNKSQIVTFGATLLLSNAIVESAELKLLTPINLENGTEFRAYLPEGTYTLLQEAKDKLEWSNSQIMSLVLAYFAYNPGIQKLYQAWAQKFADENGLAIAQVEQLVYDRRRLQARKQRLKLSKQQNRFIDDRKIAT